MSVVITMIDHGIGNLLSVERAFRHVGADFRVAKTAAEILAADKLVLPGVGAFTSCMAEMGNRGFSEPLRAFVAQGKPLLGICAGMQMLFETSEEFGIHSGFGFIKGVVKAIPPVGTDGKSHRIPHIGWSPLLMPEGRNGWEGTILKDTPVNTDVYFVHSFAAHPAGCNDRLADASYDGCPIAAIVTRDNVTGIQFHPEKSGAAGLRILENFVRM